MKRNEIRDFTDLGAYSVLYQDVYTDNICCPNCARDLEDDELNTLVSFIHWEGISLNCDSCNKELVSEYGEGGDDE